MPLLEDSSCTYLSSYCSHYRVMVLFIQSLFLLLLMFLAYCLLSVPYLGCVYVCAHGELNMVLFRVHLI